MEKELWFAVNKSGQGSVFVERPERDEHFCVWTGTIVGCISSVLSLLESEGLKLPSLKWKDEPARLMLRIDYEE